ncbi:MAG: hypothetical protein ACHQT8_00425 [Chlamydiales bacterium]
MSDKRKIEERKIGHGNVYQRKIETANYSLDRERYRLHARFRISFFSSSLITHRSSLLIFITSVSFFRFLLLLLLVPFWLSGEPAHKIQTISSQGHYLTLDDGSTWNIGWWNTWSSWHWKLGESVQILKEKEEYFLLNLDQPEKRARIAVTVCPSLEGTEHRHFIAEILEDGEVVKLENGFAWRVRWPGTRNSRGSEETNAQMMKRWRVGDEIGLYDWYDATGTGLFYYVLQNFSLHSSVPALFYEKQGTYQSLHVKDVGWTSITLDDGSSWEYEESLLFMRGWKQGDPVILYIANRQDPTRYCLVKCNAPPRDSYCVRVHKKG